MQEGTRLYVHRRLNTESWEDRNSREKRYRTSVVAEKLIVLRNDREPSTNGQDSQRGSDKKEEVPAGTTAAYDDSEILFLGRGIVAAARRQHQDVSRSVAPSPCDTHRIR